MNETSQPTDLFLPLTRQSRRPLCAQVEDQLRRAIRSGVLVPGTRLPSTRDLATQLDISRGVVVNAYAQLGAEGYLVLRPRSRARISDFGGPRSTPAEVTLGDQRPRFDFRLGAPDVSRFPRTVWVRCLRTALLAMSNADLGYGDERGVERLRAALAEYLGRVRGVVADPERVVVTSGYLQAQGLVCRALASTGRKRIAFEDPSDAEPRVSAARAGLEVVPIGVDEAGLRIDELERAVVDAVVVTPAHQFPTGAVLAPARRAALLEWLRRRDAVAIEDDYDAEYRYDRSPVGALQGLDPDRVVYAGSASKTLAPALRIGWLVVPRRLLGSVANEKLLADRGTARIEQHAFAEFLDRGELDRHLRRMRTRYRRRRDALVCALADELPDATVEGIAAGLHAAVRLTDDDDETAILEEARRRRIALGTIQQFAIEPTGGPPTILLGYAQTPEATIRAGVAEFADMVRALRRRS